MQRQRPEIVARAQRDIERVELDLIIMLAAAQTVDVDAVDAEQDGFTVQDERVRPVAQRGLNNALVPALQS